MSDFLQGIFAQYPWLAVVGPLVGFLIARLKDLGKLSGFGLLGVSLGVTVLTVACYGFAEGWPAHEWHKVPFAVLVLMGVSNLTSTTVLHTRDAITKKLGASPQSDE
jgi:hypothetical protein